MNKSLLVVFFLLFPFVLLANGGSEVEPFHIPQPTGEQVSIDGVVGEGEYDLVMDKDSHMAIYVQQDGDVVHLAAIARSSGWIALGLGSAKMDGAHMLFGFVEPDGTVRFEEHLGRGWSHAKTEDVFVIDYDVNLIDGVITLEVTVPLEEVQKAEGAFIYAYGPRPNFTVKHLFRGSGRFDL